MPILLHLTAARSGPADRAALITDAVLAVGQAFGLKFDEMHNDSTTVSFCGAYRSAWGRKIRGRTAPAITYGPALVACRGVGQFSCAAARGRFFPSTSWWPILRRA